MPTYILHGGEPQIPCEGNNNFFEEIANKLPLNGHFLCVYFASPEEEWEQDFKTMTKKLNAIKPTQTTMASFDNFEEEIKKADVVYFHGGSTQPLLNALIKIDISLLKENKVYVGCSAGVNMLCEYGYSAVSEKIMKGLGILPFNALVHSGKPDYDISVEKFKTHSTNKPLIRIPETEFITLEF